MVDKNKEWDLGMQDTSVFNFIFYVILKVVSKDQHCEEL
jgi:hypothetical protein